MANETVYITSNEDSHVMSEKVQSLAGSIYKEFERVIKKYDEDVVKDLMPLVVGILEALDASSIEKQELDVELELLREDNEQLLTQYEREKQHRKVAEQKYLEMEDNLEGAKKELEDKVETLESILRMSEIKSKNAADHVSRLEDREQEAKNEYSRLHERYTELFRTHMDYVERTKILLGTDKLSEPTVTVPRIMKGGIIVPEMCPVIVAPGGRMEYQRQDSRTEEPRAEEPRGGTNNSLSLLHELQTPTDREQLTDSISVTRKAIDKRLNQTLAEIIATTPELVETHDFLKSEASPGKSSNDHDESSVFEEIQTTDIAEVEFGAEISGACPVSISDDAGSDEGGEESKENDRETAGPVVETVGVNFFGMCKELENLIVENKELLATKNALNIVKNDLITRIDVLTSEQEIQKQEINMHNTVRKKLQERISKLEEELRKLKEELEGRNKDQTEKEDDEDDVPMAQRKRFTRVEMARVLMERNQFKERLMELQEAVRWTEMIRASREHPGELPTKKKLGIWNLFGSLFSSSTKPKPNQPVAAYCATSTDYQSGSEQTRKLTDQGTMSRSYFLQDDIYSDTSGQKREQYKWVRALAKADDGRMQAYGWSLPATFTAIALRDASLRSNVPVPVPVYCRPLFGGQLGWKIWCAAGVNLTGARTGSQGCFEELSPLGVPLLQGGINLQEGDQSDKENDQNSKNVETEQLSSLIWICTSSHDSSQVSVIDANNPADVIDSFSVSVSHILCIASLPGVQENDYPTVEDIVGDLPAETRQSAEASSDDISMADEDNGGVEKASWESAEGRDDEGENKLWPSVSRAKGSPATSFSTTPPQTGILGPIELSSDQISEGRSQASETNMSSTLPTMWLGTHSGSLYIHSSVSNWKRCLRSVRLKDSVLAIIHVRGRALVSLADGTVAVFQRSADGEWDLENYHLIDIGQGRQAIRCMTVVDNQQVWCGCKNRIHIISPQSMVIEKSFEAHPRKESQVRQLCWVGDGVWVYIRLDSTLRLFHAHSHQHLQDVDVEPYMAKMLGMYCWQLQRGIHQISSNVYFPTLSQLKHLLRPPQTSTMQCCHCSNIYFPA